MAAWWPSVADAPLGRALRQQLPDAEQRLFRALTYATGRQEAEAAILYLIQHANTVYAEQLNLTGIWPGLSPVVACRRRSISICSGCPRP